MTQPYTSLRHLHTAGAVLAATLLLGLAAQDAHAAGFAAARFGGEHGNPTESNPSALYYNPGGLGLSDGHQLTLDVTFAWRTASYDRPVDAISGDTSGMSEDAIAANTGEGTLNNYIWAPMAAFTTDFGMDIGLVGGFAFYAPFGGQAVWDKADPNAAFPGAEAGSQRWYTIDGTIRTLAYTAGLGYYIEPAKLSLGVTGSLLQSEINTVRARNADGTDNVGNGEFQIEGRSLIDATSLDWNLGVGLLWNPMKDQLWVGLSYTSAPNLTGEQVLEGTLQNLLATGQPTVEDIKLTSGLPDIIRLGARYRPSDKLELRLFGDYTRWSLLEQQCLIGAAATDLDTACATNGTTGASTNPDKANAVIQVLQRRWQDAFGLRLGGSYWVIPEVELLLGGGFDSNAIPDENLEPALFDMNKFTGSVGVRYEFLKNMGFMLTATEVFYLERDTTGANTASTLDPPSRQPSSEGVYNQNIFLVNANVQVGF